MLKVKKKKKKITQNWQDARKQDTCDSFSFCSTRPFIAKKFKHFLVVCQISFQWNYRLILDQ